MAVLNTNSWASLFRLVVLTLPDLRGAAAGPDAGEAVDATTGVTSAAVASAAAGAAAGAAPGLHSTADGLKLKVLALALSLKEVGFDMTVDLSLSETGVGGVVPSITSSIWRVRRD
jgi:hypothetical protein